MGAGQPNWNQLLQMGKLPKSQYAKVPMLGELTEVGEELKRADAEILRLKNGLCEDCKESLLEKDGSVKEEKVKLENAIEKKCEVEGCDYVAEGRTEGIANNTLRMHGKAHEKK